MDNVREKVNELNRNRKKKIFIGMIAILIIVVGAFFIERAISMNVTEITIKKSKISDEKAVFIPLRQLDTNIIAVKLSDGSYSLAFDDCMGCYTMYGKHAKFENNADNTGLICKNCKSEIAYEDMGYGEYEVVMPYPIHIAEIVETEDSFVLSKEYLEKHKEIFEELRQGKAQGPSNEYSAK